ncbi:MAG: CBS domain-containing protein [Planctomycetota bacterium]|nr:CBS domain-containing protein [Planctomycetota bacterium]
MSSTETPAAGASRWGLVTARDLMRTDVVTVSYASPLSDVERTLSEHRISGAPVTDEAGHIIGILSLKDLVARYAENSDARPRRSAGFFHLSSEEMLDDDFESFSVPNEAEETAGDLMTGEVYSVDVAASLKDVAQAMLDHKVHRVLVQEDGRYVGLLSTMEILAALSA